MDYCNTNSVKPSQAVQKFLHPRLRRRDELTTFECPYHNLYGIECSKPASILPSQQHRWSRTAHLNFVWYCRSLNKLPKAPHKSQFMCSGTVYLNCNICGIMRCLSTIYFVRRKYAIMWQRLRTMICAVQMCGVPGHRTVICAVQESYLVQLRLNCINRISGFADTMLWICFQYDVTPIQGFTDACWQINKGQRYSTIKFIDL